MKIAFFTESGFVGNIFQQPYKLYDNLRTDMAWMYHLNADHYPFSLINSNLNTEYDIGIVIPPKNNIAIVAEALPQIQKFVTKLGVMQEGPNDYWTDYTIANQFKYLYVCGEADFLLCHNRSDIPYYTGIFQKETHVLPSVLVETHISGDSSKPNRKKAIVGGNMCRWYNGLVSTIVAKQYCENDTVWIPSMGRKVAGEETIDGVEHLPYLTWKGWMTALADFELGVHLMPTSAAGTFSLNCSYWGIPCIGYNNLDTQNMLHPDLSVPISDIESAKNLAQRLKTDREFYDYCSRTTKERYNEFYSSAKFIQTMKRVFGKLLNIPVDYDLIEF